jgi:hypothetical protein
MTTSPTLWPTLLEQVDTANGVYKIKMEALRQLEGAQRMGPNVAEAVQNRLATLGIQHLPADLNIRQDREVLLMKVGTPALECVNAIIDAVQGDKSVSDTVASWLVRLNTTPEPQDIVHRSELREPVEGIMEKITELLGMSTPPARQQPATPLTPVPAPAQERELHHS